MANPDFTSDDPYEVLDVSIDTPYEDIQNQAKKLYNKYDHDEDKQVKINEAIKEIPKLKVVSGEVNIELYISVQENSVSFRDEITLVVTDQVGNKVEDATIFDGDGGRIGNTNQSGECTYKVRKTGGLTFEADKSHPDSNVHYITSTAEDTIDVSPEVVSLEFEECPNSATIGDTVTVQVTDGTNGIQGCEIKMDGTAVGNTNINGYDDIQVSGQSGEVTLEATKGRDANREYKNAKESIQVYKKQVQLSFEQSPTSVSVGDTARFRVTDGSSPVRGVTVKHSKDSDQTDTNGYATLSFEKLPLGKTTITANKGSQGGFRYNKTTTTVKVTEKKLDISLSCLTGHPVVDQPISFKVVDENNDSLDGAIVRAINGEVDRTNREGEADLTFTSAGKKRVEVTKQNTGKRRYGTDDVLIDVNRQTKQLELKDVPKEVEAGESFSVKVSMENQPVKDAVVQPEVGDDEKTDFNGRARLSISKEGNRDLTVQKPPDDKVRYQSISREICVKEPPKELTIVNAPDTVVGEPVKIEVHDHRDQPVSDVTVKAKGSSIAKEKETGSDGTVEFVFTDISPPQWVEIEAIDFSGEYDGFANDVLKVDN